ncbi:MAG: long-chain fatty acid--CoA ligase [Bacteroidales bacterium]
MKQHIAHMVKNRASKYGSREVYRFKDKSDNTYKPFSWDQLTASFDKVSKALIKMGFGFESKIGIFSNNRIEWSITDYGILTIRGIVVPFFGNATKEQVKYIVDETKMELMFVGDQEQFEKAKWVLQHSTSLKQIISLDRNLKIESKDCMDWEPFITSGNDADLDSRLTEIYDEAKPEDIATILYTSGTTGEPKGVMLDHANFMYAFSIHDERLDVHDKDVSMCFLPLSHVFERTWSFYVLYRGAVNVFLENPREVIDELPKAKPTLLCTVPRFFEKTHEGIFAEYEKWPSYKKKIFDWSISVGNQRSILKSENKKIPGLLELKFSLAEKLVLKKLRSIFGGNIRMIPCSGAAIRVDLLKFFHATGLWVNHGYGTTETTATVSCFESHKYQFGTIGKKMPGLEVKISDRGEILVKGKTVFKGYYNKPDATSEVLKDGWYHTGDEGSIDENGDMVMTDRIKDLFKTSVGKYVSPQKIELILGQDPFIEQVITIGDDRKYVTALIVPVLANIRAHANMLGLHHSSDAHLISLKEVQDFFKKRIEKMQNELASYEKVVKFTLLHEPFTVENNAMTSTLKIRRKIIMEQYKNLIEQMY